MGTQCDSATLPDAVSPYFKDNVYRTTEKCRIFGTSELRKYGIVLGKVALSRMKSEDLPFAIVRSLLGIKGMDRPNY